MTDFVIIANGTFASPEVIHPIIQNKIVVALDGAANKLIELNIKPDVALGDFDSIHSKLLKRNDIRFISLPDQNHTDLRKGIRYCDTQGAKSITILCATGGRMDHHESAVRSLRTEYKTDRPIVLHADNQILRLVKDEELVITGNIGDKCGVLAYPSAVLTTHGLEYDVTDYELVFGFSDSTSNALRLPEASIAVKGEALLIISNTCYKVAVQRPRGGTEGGLPRRD